MNRKLVGQIVVMALMCALTALIVLWLVRKDQQKVAVVDAVKLFNSYKMKIEMEAADGAKLELLAKRTDSLKKALNVLNAVEGAPKEAVQNLYRVYQMEQANLEAQFEQSNHSINEQVWKMLNPLVDEYAKENGLRLIVGANGIGSVLYFDGYYDNTEELINYVNKRYETGR